MVALLTVIGETPYLSETIIRAKDAANMVVGCKLTIYSHIRHILSGGTIFPTV